MSERMKWSEAEAVVRAYRAERGITSDIDVETLAQMLGTDVADIRRLASKRRRFTDGAGVISAVVALSALALAGPSFAKHNPLLASLRGSEVQVNVVAPGVPVPPVPPMPSQIIVKEFRSHAGPNGHIYLSPLDIQDES